MHVHPTAQPATVLLVATILATSALARPYRIHDQAELLQDEIKCLNLINSLYLSPEQLGKIVPLAEKGAHGRGVLEKRAAELGDMFVAPGGLLKKALEQGQQVDERLAQPVHQSSAALKDMTESHERFEEDLARQIAATLDDNQKQRVRDYRACLVPTPDLREPDRIGSASPTAEGPSKLLDRARAVPQQRFEAKKSEWMEKLLEKVRKHYAGVDPGVYRAKVEDVLERARKMDDLQYETNREALLKELKPPDANLRQSDTESVEAKVRHFFLNPCMPELLKTRLHLLTEHHPQGRPVDLSHLAPESNCKDGHCALNR